MRRWTTPEIVAALAMALAAGFFATRCPGQTVPAPAAPAPTAAYGFTAWLNGVRARYGLPPVGYDPNLAAWAQANNAQQQHRGLGHFVMGPARRQNAGWSPGGFGPVPGMWLASPGHRAALLDPTKRSRGQVPDTAPVSGPAPVEKGAPEGHTRGLLIPPDWAARIELQNRRPDVRALRAQIQTLEEAPLPAAWRVKALTPVRDQGQYGNCWAFATVGAVESLYLAAGRDLNLSEQFIVNHNRDGFGCYGGDVAFEFLRTVGTSLESECPYQGCAGSDAAKPTVKVTGWGYVADTTAPPDVATLKAALLTHGALAVAVAATPEWDAYQAGQVLARPGVVNHEVLLVGWDDAKNGGRGAWLVKNSWGPRWGEAGYGWVAYGACRIGTGAAFCSIAPPPAPTPSPTPTPSPAPDPAPSPAAPDFVAVDPKWVDWNGGKIGLVRVKPTTRELILLVSPPGGK